MRADDSPGQGQADRQPEAGDGQEEDLSDAHGPSVVSRHPDLGALVRLSQPDILPPPRHRSNGTSPAKVSKIADALTTLRAVIIRTSGRLRRRTLMTHGQVRSLLRYVCQVIGPPDGGAET